MKNHVLQHVPLYTQFLSVMPHGQMVKASMPHGCQKVMFNQKNWWKGTNFRKQGPGKNVAFPFSWNTIISLSKLFSQICCGLSDLEFHFFKHASRICTRLQRLSNLNQESHRCYLCIHLISFFAHSFINMVFHVHQWPTLANQTKMSLSHFSSGLFLFFPTQTMTVSYKEKRSNFHTIAVAFPERNDVYIDRLRRTLTGLTHRTDSNFFFFESLFS